MYNIKTIFSWAVYYKMEQIRFIDAQTWLRNLGKPSLYGNMSLTFLLMLKFSSHHPAHVSSGHECLRIELVMQKKKKTASTVKKWNKSNKRCWQKMLVTITNNSIF